MVRLMLVVAAVAAPHGAASAQMMPVPQFLAKAEALEKKGAMALFSSDVGVLKKEISESAAQLRAERLAARKAGRKPAYCPPEKGGALGSTELLAHFRAIPPAERARMRVRDGLRSLMIRKYPCPA